MTLSANDVRRDARPNLSRDLPTMTTTEPNLASALAAAGADDVLRYALFDLLRAAEQRASDSRGFRDQVRAPLITALLGQVGTHTVELSTGLKFEVSPASRIEMALLLSSEDRPNHVWEPQTTKLLTTLARGCRHVIRLEGCDRGQIGQPRLRTSPRRHGRARAAQLDDELLYRPVSPRCRNGTSRPS